MPITQPDRRVHRRRRRSTEMSPSAIGGALTFGAVAGLTLGPLGTVAGLVVGGTVGELLDRYVDDHPTTRPHDPVQGRATK